MFSPALPAAAASPAILSEQPLYSFDNLLKLTSDSKTSHCAVLHKTDHSLFFMTERQQNVFLAFQPQDFHSEDISWNKCHINLDHQGDKHVIARAWNAIAPIFLKYSHIMPASKVVILDEMCKKYENKLKLYERKMKLVTHPEYISPEEHVFDPANDAIIFFSTF